MGMALEARPASLKWHWLYTAEAVLLALAVWYLAPGRQLFECPPGMPWFGGPAFLPALVGLVTAFTALAGGIDALMWGGHRHWPLAITVTLSTSALLITLVPVLRMAVFYLVCAAAWLPL
jgi:hypothetical protein